MVPYNEGRFAFIFDSGTNKLLRIYDTKYKKSYSVNHHEFFRVFSVAVNSLNKEALDALKKRLENEPKYGDIISNIENEK